MVMENQVVVNSIKCASIEGIEAKEVEVEGSLTKGLPSFNIVGLASSDIQEAKERAKNALLASDINLPALRITINLSPSDIKKSGTHFDLAIALLVALGESEIAHKDIFVFGELGLDGKVKSSSLIFPLILSLKEQGKISKAVVPKDALEALKFIDGVDFFGVETLQEAIALLSKESLKDSNMNNCSYSANELKIGDKSFFYTQDYESDFSDILGQEVAIRAALVAASGMHNILLNGSPGSGKSMIAKRLRYILPPLSQDEILSIARAEFLDGKEPNFKPLRPFRSPHHTATSAAIFGGGSFNAKIGEVALANKGILFFDELPHFNSKVLEALREPLQDRVINIARVNSKVSYSADFLFIGAMNPCPCGNLLSKVNSCRCSDVEIKRYKNRLSDPFLDRVDIFVTMSEVDFNKSSTTTSKDMHQVVLKAFQAQIKRGQKTLNGSLQEGEIEKFCILEDDAKDILEQAIVRFGLSFRSLANIKKVARTIADINGNELIGKKDILEALSYRKRD
jgi:magnesium chelatase family protein